MRYLASLIVCALFLVLAAPGPLSAQGYRAREGVQNGQVRSLDQILNGIRRDRPGNLADVEGPNYGPGGDARYRLKWVSPDGRVQWLDTDARTGRVLGVEGEGRGRPDFNDPRGNAPPRGNFVPRNQSAGPPDAGPDPRFDRGPDRSGGFGRRGGFERGRPPEGGFDRGGGRRFERPDGGSGGGFRRGGSPGGGPPSGSDGNGPRGRFGRFGR